MVKHAAGLLHFLLDVGPWNILRTQGDVKTGIDCLYYFKIETSLTVYLFYLSA